MMADETANIRQAFESLLNGVTDIPSIAWENITFTPTSQTSYIKPRLVPTRREPAVRGLSPQLLYQGYFLVECFVAKGQGPKAGDDLAAKVLEAFEATTDIGPDANTKIHIRYAERDLADDVGDYYKVPVRIGYQLYK
jgi:hypothetical protein